MKVSGHLAHHDARHRVDEEARLAVDGPATLLERSSEQQHRRDHLLVPEPLPPALGDDVRDGPAQFRLRRGGEVIHHRLDDAERVLLGLLHALSGIRPFGVAHPRLREKQRGPGSRHLLGAGVDARGELHALLLGEFTRDSGEIDALELVDVDAPCALGRASTSLDGADAGGIAVGTSLGGDGAGVVAGHGSGRGTARGDWGRLGGVRLDRVGGEAEGVELLKARHRAQVRERVHLVDGLHVGGRRVHLLRGLLAAVPRAWHRSHGGRSSRRRRSRRRVRSFPGRHLSSPDVTRARNADC